MRLKERSSVLLPQPEGPMMAVTLCPGTSSVTCLSAWCVPYHRSKSRVTMHGAAVPGSGATASPGGPLPADRGRSLRRQLGAERGWSLHGHLSPSPAGA